MPNQQTLIGQLLDKQWTKNKLGEAQVPVKIVEFLSCWGDSNTDNKQALFTSVENRCRLDEHIYLNRRLRTGAVEMEYEWLSSKEFSELRFFNFFSKSISGAGPGNAASKHDVTNYSCNDTITVNQHEVSTKSILCFRAYDDFSTLYDVLFVGASLNHVHQGLITHFTLAGVSKESAMDFTRRFMEEVSWQ